MLGYKEYGKRQLGKALERQFGLSFCSIVSEWLRLSYVIIEIRAFASLAFQKLSHKIVYLTYLSSVQELVHKYRYINDIKTIGAAR